MHKLKGTEALELSPYRWVHALDLKEKTLANSPECTGDGSRLSYFSISVTKPQDQANLQK